MIICPVLDVYFIYTGKLGILINILLDTPCIAFMLKPCQFKYL